MVYNPYIDQSIPKDMWARYVKYRERSHRLKGSPLFALPVPPCRLILIATSKTIGWNRAENKFIPHPDKAEAFVEVSFFIIQNRRLRK